MNPKSSFKTSKKILNDYIPVVWHNTGEIHINTCSSRIYFFENQRSKIEEDLVPLVSSNNYLHKNALETNDEFWLKK